MMRDVRSTLKGLLAAVLVAAAGSLTVASTFLKEDVESLGRKAESVVHARVSGVRSYWNDAHTMIFTDVTLQVKTLLHGRAAQQFVVRVPGGTVNDYTIEMEGAPEFKTNEEVVAFLAHWDDGVPMVAGYFQGLSHVSRDKIGNAMLRGGVADGLPIPELARHLRLVSR